MFRYAVYFAPARSTSLWQAGCEWLGRDPETGALLPLPTVPGLPAGALEAATSEARRYGLHATLKPPFRLATEHTPDELRSAVAALADDTAAFSAPPLQLTTIDGFLALTPGTPQPALRSLADRAVVELDRFRAPASAEELAKRQAGGLSIEAEQRLARWGYPHVLDGFRFHITLTRRLTPSEHALVRPALALHLGRALTEPLPVADLCLFAEAEPGLPFRLLQRFALGTHPRSA